MILREIAECLLEKHLKILPCIIFRSCLFYTVIMKFHLALGNLCSFSNVHISHGRKVSSNGAHFYKDLTSTAASVIICTVRPKHRRILRNCWKELLAMLVVLHYRGPLFKYIETLPVEYHLMPSVPGQLKILLLVLKVLHFKIRCLMDSSPLPPTGFNFI